MLLTWPLLLSFLLPFFLLLSFRAPVTSSPHYCPFVRGIHRSEFPSQRDSDAEFLLQLSYAIMPTLSSLVAQEVVTMTTSGATSDDKVGIMTTLGFWWGCVIRTWRDVGQLAVRITRSWRTDDFIGGTGIIQHVSRHRPEAVQISDRLYEYHTGCINITEALQISHRLYEYHRGFTEITQAVWISHRLYKYHTDCMNTTEAL